MNAKTIIAAVALTLGSASSFAENIGWHVSKIDESPSTLTRDEVRAELDRANAAGEVIGIRYAYGGTVPAAGTAAGTAGSSDLTRAQVKAELAAAQQNGDLVTSFAGKTERELFPGRYPAVQPMGIAHSSATSNVN
jgi:hypothetical protein